MGVSSMFIVIQKRHIICTALFCCFFAGLAAVLWTGHSPSAPVFAARDGVPVTVVVDPGHGGEDGGAVGADGAVESQINLSVALRVNDLLRFAGQQTIMTRTEDVSIHTEGTETMHQRKVSDLKNRVALVNATENAVLLSIHQNSLPSSPVTHGAQVFWNVGEDADVLAASVQDALNAGINQGNEKKPKKIPSNIYLTKNVTAPGIIVECGFLSNSEETALLQEPSYQLRLAAAILAGFCGAGEDRT